MGGGAGRRPAWGGGGRRPAWKGRAGWARDETGKARNHLNTEDGAQTSTEVHAAPGGGVGDPAGRGAVAARGRRAEQGRGALNARQPRNCRWVAWVS